jgi:hypothetical protein
MKALGLFAAAAAVAVAPGARAATRAPVHAALDWHRLPGGESCSDAATLERAVESRLGRKIFVSHASADVVVVARVGPARRGTGWVADLELRTADGQVIGTRELTTADRSCSALDPSVALVVALMVDIPKSDLPRPAPTPRAPRQEKPTPIRLPAEPARSWRVKVELAGSAVAGVLPGVIAGANLGWGLKPPGWPLIQIDASLYPKAEVERDGLGTRFSFASVGLDLCPFEWEGLRARVWGCLRQRLGQITGDGFGFSENLRQSRAFYGVGLGAGAAFRLTGPFELVAGVGAEAPITRDRFTYLDAVGHTVQLFRMAPIFGSTELGLGLSF